MYNTFTEYCVALYPYQSVESGDLSFVQGETIIVVKKEGDWWTGVIGDRQGIFPANYVQVMTTTDVSKMRIIFICCKYCFECI